MEVYSVVALKYICRFSESVKSNSFSLKKIKKKILATVLGLNCSTLAFSSCDAVLVALQPVGS